MDACNSQSARSAANFRTSAKAAMANSNGIECQEIERELSNLMALVEVDPDEENPASLGELHA